PIDSKVIVPPFEAGSCSDGSKAGPVPPPSTRGGLGCWVGRPASDVFELVTEPGAHAMHSASSRLISRVRMELRLGEEALDVGAIRLSSCQAAGHEMQRSPNRPGERTGQL